MTAPPKVSVLMPVYNAERYLAAAIESILRQRFADLELLIIDDGSTDRSREIAQGYADPRIRLLRNAQNLRLIATLNRGLEEARGEYVARMDADDISLPRRVAAQVEFLDRNPAVGVLGGAVQLIGPDGRAEATVRYPASHALIRWTLLFSSPLAHPAVMMRKAVIARLGGYRAQALHCEDYDLWWRAVDETRIANLDEMLLQLRRHDASVTLQNAAVHVDGAQRVCRAMLSQALQSDIPPLLVAAARLEAAAPEELVPQTIELICRYHRFCVAAEGQGEASALRWDLKKRIARVLDARGAHADTPWSRLRRVRRRARLASGASRALVRDAALLAGARILFRAVFPA